MIRILLIDDHPIVREGLAAILEDQPDFQVVGAAGSAEEALSLIERLAPDLVLLDLELGEMGGIEAIPEILHAAPEARILVFTAYDTDERVRGALEAGAGGYLLKGAPAAEIAQAIRILYAGGSYLEPRVAAKVLAQYRSPRRAADILSAREREVLRLVAAGMRNKEIARTLGITERTVKYHVASILTKLDADSRAHAVALAIQHGLLEK